MKFSKCAEKHKSFFRPNYKKLILFVAVLIFVPVPFSGGLFGGVAPIASALADLLPGAYFLLRDGSSFFFFFLGWTMGLLFVGYFLACLIYKILFGINKNNENISWLHMFIAVALLFVVYLISYFNNMIYISA